MRISIVVPAYNVERYLGQTIESVLAQTFTDWELIIVDDGSTDGTAKVASQYVDADPRIRAVQQENKGVATARNRGFGEANVDSQYVVFIDADDVWEKDALARLVQALEAHPEAVAASGLSRQIDAEGEPCNPGELEIWGRRRQGVVGHRLVSWPVHCPTKLAVLAYRNCIHTPGQMLVRRSALAAVGPFDPATSPCEDWDMSLRLSQRGDIAYVDRVLLNWRLHDYNASTQKALMTQQMNYVRWKLLSSPGLSEEQRLIAVTANCLWYRSLASTRLCDAMSHLGRCHVRQAVQQLGSALAGYALVFRGVSVRYYLSRRQFR